MTDLVLESILIAVITAISLWIVLELNQLPLRARKATAVVIVLWAVFWGIRMTRSFMYRLEPPLQSPASLHMQRGRK